MTPEEAKAIAHHVRELSKLVYKDAEANQMPMTNLGEIEVAVREQVQKHVTLEIGIFLSKQLQIAVQDTRDS